jgi:hypothetical protein
VIFDETAFPFKEQQASSQFSPSSTNNYPLQLLSFNNLPTISSSDDNSTSISVPSTPSPHCQTLDTDTSLSLPPKPPITHVYSRRSTAYPLTVPPSPLPQPSKSPPTSSHQMITRAKSRLSVSTGYACYKSSYQYSGS